MDLQTWTLVAGVLTSVIGVLAAGLAEIGIRSVKRFRIQLDRGRGLQVSVVRASKRSPKKVEELDSKIARAHELSQQAARLNAEVKAEFDLQFEAAKRAKVEAETAKREANDAEAVKDQYEKAIDAARNVISTELEGVINKNAKSERRFQIVVAVVSFFAGVIATTVVSLVLQALVR